MDFEQNPIALITCAVIVGIYIIVLILMYRKDRKEQVSEYVIPFIGADDGFYQYEIRIKTGALPFAGRSNFEYFFRKHSLKGFSRKRFS